MHLCLMLRRGELVAPLKLVICYLVSPFRCEFGLARPIVRNQTYKSTLFLSFTVFIPSRALLILYVGPMRSAYCVGVGM